ncbi:MAG TPA: DUF3109 family protein [Balneolaceae bacterium]|nr:DUF3109 family protein [Balneolaceae bacterium]
MFRVKDVILSEDIARAKFACDVTRCKGACCVVGDAGAPIEKDEIPAIRKAFHLLKDELSSEARKTVETDGLFQGDSEKGFEISCIDNKECIFVTYDENETATCSIQKAYYNGRLNWEKPVSCHLYPIRLKNISGLEFANFEYMPEMCGTACDRGEAEGMYLADYLKAALIRRYGEEWYNEFRDHCLDVRKKNDQ